MLKGLGLYLETVPGQPQHLPESQKRSWGNGLRSVEVVWVPKQQIHFLKATAFM